MKGRFNMKDRDKIAGGLYGLLIGDALGVPYEFYKPEALPSYDQIEMTPPPGFRKTYPQVEAGTWSDDGAQALCLLDSLWHRMHFPWSISLTCSCPGMRRGYGR